MKLIAQSYYAWYSKETGTFHYLEEGDEAEYLAVYKKKFRETSPSAKWQLRKVSLILEDDE